MRAFQRAPISRFVLFLTIAVISALALTTNAGRALGPRAYAAPAAQNVPLTFTWSMAKRFGPKRPHGTFRLCETQVPRLCLARRHSLFTVTGV